jgi:hypothetical protein
LQRKKTQVRFAHNNNNYKKIWNFFPRFGQILTSSKNSLTSATVVANMALTSSWDLFQSKDDKNWLDETPGSKTKSNLSSPQKFIYMFVVSGHLSIGLPTLSLPTILYLGITNEAGWQGIEVC